jgi:hypothetical protein
MRQRVLHSRRRVVNTSVPSASQRLGHRSFRVKPVFPNDERPSLGGAWISRTVREGSHSSINRTSAVYFTVCAVLLLYFWVVLLYSSPTVYPCFCDWVFVTQYTCQITFIGDPRLSGIRISSQRVCIFGSITPTYFRS